MLCYAEASPWQRSIRTNRCCFRNWPRRNRPHRRPPVAEPEPSRRGKSKPHGRRRPARQLRREPRRYELPTLEQLCPECGVLRDEIGVQTSEQYDYRPAEVFVIEHQRVKYACKCCAGHVAMAPKPPQPLDKGLPGPGLLARSSSTNIRTTFRCTAPSSVSNGSASSCHTRPCATGWRRPRSR
jgi:zinc-finger binding domain of transposase IS66